MSALELHPSTFEDFQLLAETPGLLTGRFSGIDGDDYHKRLPGVSKTSIEHAAISLANMIAHKKMAADEESEALLIGKLFHSRVEHKNDLEKFRKQFVVMPVFGGEGMKAAKEKWNAENKGKTIIAKADADMIEGMFRGMLAHPTASGLVEAPGEVEETIFWTDEESGVLCKCRPDKRIPDFLGAHLGVDWKSIGQFSKRDIQDAIYEHNYHVSAAFTIDGCKAVGIELDSYVFVFVQKKAPHQVLCVPAQADDIELGRRKYKLILKQIAEAQQTNVWPGFVDLGMSEWARQREMEALGIY